MNATSAAAVAASGDFVISRVFDAPRDLVWTCFTDLEHMKAWWGPKGLTVDRATMTLKPGGMLHYRLTSASGFEMWGRMSYREIAPKDRIVCVSAFSDEAGGLAPHAIAPEWPVEILVTLTFEDAGPGKTRLTVVSTPINATEDERGVFEAGHGSMSQGWGGTLDKLAAHLAKEG
jgi:uncharacterized protein YndB with AHSA1/START domain